MNLLWNAVERARARAAGARLEGDAGFMMIYVLTIIGVITTVVGSTLVVTSASVVPTVQSAYDQAADAAAQGALQAFVAYADKYCANATSSVADCNLPTNYSGLVDIATPGAGSSYSAQYSWLAAKDPSNRYFRVKGKGVVKQGGLSATKVVVGDIVGGSSMNIGDYGVVIGFEGQSSSTVLAEWPQRTIALDCTAVDAADVPIKGDKCSTNSSFLNSINWSGASPGTAAGKVAVCNATFDAKGGRSNNLPNKAPNPYVDWTEAGLNGNNYTHFEPCQVSWGTRTKLLAPDNPADGPGGYASNDALLLSNSYPGGSGPLFNQKVTTSWKYTTDDAGICGTAPGQNYRSFNILCAGYPVEVGGAPSSASLYPTVESGQVPQIPTADPTVPATACVYAGPTRVQLNGDTAVVTSPQTTASWVAANAASRPSQCYTGAGASGMALQTVNLSSPVSIQVLVAADDGSVPKTTPAIAHGSSGWPSTGQRLGDTATTSNSVFYLTNGASGSSTSTANTVTASPGTYVPAANDNPSTKTDGAWVPQWTSYSNASCTSTPALTNLQFANCYLPIGTYPDAYSWLKASVQAAIAANPTSYNSTSSLQTLVNSFVSQGNSSDASSGSPTNADYRSRKFNVTVTQANGGGCTQSTGVAGTASDTPVSPPSNDAFFQNTNGNVHVAPKTDTTCFTATVTAQVGTCNIALAAGVCVNVGNYVWGNGTALLGGGVKTAQFAVTFTAKKTTTTTTTTPATSTFPSMSDVTQYSMGLSGTFGASGPGDLYVEGNAAHTMSVIGMGDIVLTGTAGTTDTTHAALQIVGQNNVRIYHPVQCRITDATAISTTSPGFCPDDITGLYSTVAPDGTRPYQQYVNMRTDLAGLTIHAQLFALGNAGAHITCPEPPNGGGVCGGEFGVDNYNRGAPLGYLTEVGTIAMAHHAPMGQEWDVADSPGQTSRPYSGYQLAQQYQNIKALIAAASDVGSVLHTTTSTSSLWHILSISTGTDA
jgi:hypothetical protein